MMLQSGELFFYSFEDNNKATKKDFVFFYMKSYKDKINYFHFEQEGLNYTIDDVFSNERDTIIAVDKHHKTVFIYNNNTQNFEKSVLNFAVDSVICHRNYRGVILAQAQNKVKPLSNLKYFTLIVDSTKSPSFSMEGDICPCQRV